MKKLFVLFIYFCGIAFHRDNARLEVSVLGQYRKVMLKLLPPRSKTESREKNDELLIISFEPLGPTMPEANIYSEIFSHRKLQISASSIFFLGSGTELTFFPLQAKTS